MRILNAVDAITPAWSHTQRLLLAPRNWRLLLKIGTVAVLAEMGGCNFNANLPGKGAHMPTHLPSAIGALLVASVLLVVLVVVVGLSLLFFYLGSRLQFVLFDVVLRRETTIAPIWRRYGRATWYWMALKFVVFLLAAICVLPILIPVLLQFTHAVASTPSGGQVPPQKVLAFFSTILGFIGAIFVVLIVIAVIQSLLRDFGLPSMALESTTLGETAARIWRLVRTEPLQILIYLVLRFLLALTGAIFAEIVLVIAMLIALIPLGGAAGVLWVTLHKAGGAGFALMIAGFVVLGLALVVSFFCAAFMLLGYVQTFLQAYALYFLGGRYPLLGEILEPAPPMPPPYFAAPTPPPVWPAPVGS
jgi:hypothetical protein